MPFTLYGHANQAYDEGHADGLHDVPARTRHLPRPNKPFAHYDLVNMVRRCGYDAGYAAGQSELNQRRWEQRYITNKVVPEAPPTTVHDLIDRPDSGYG